MGEQLLSQSVFKYIKDGVYPEDEAVISAELSASALDHLSQMINQAREEVKASIRELSRLHTEEVEGWISEAMQLRQDLNESQSKTAEASRLAIKRQEIEHTKTDASHKVGFLRRELGFNSSLTRTLERILSVRNIVDSAQEALLALELSNTAKLIKEAESRIFKLGECQGTVLINLLRAKIVDIRDSLLKTTLQCWQKLVVVNREEYQISIRDRFQRDPKTSIEHTVFVLQSFDLLESRLIQLKQDAEGLIFRPRIGKPTTTKRRSIAISGPVIRTTEDRPNASVEGLLSDVSGAFNYFSLILPKEITPRFLEILVPSVIDQMTCGPLALAVPPDLGGISSFGLDLSRVERFAETMGKRKWPGGDNLLHWVQDAPTVWLRHRSNSALSSVRQLLARGIGKPRTVEREEKIILEGETNTSSALQDGWNTSWSDAENTGKKHSPQGNLEFATEQSIPADDDGEAEAWGWDDENDKQNEDNGSLKPKETDEEVNEAWGWDEDNEATESETFENTKPPMKVSPRKTSSPEKRGSSAHAVTFREAYKITALPEQVLEIVILAVDDAERLATSENEAFQPIRSAGVGLIALPSLILSMFRACASNHYMNDASGNMFLYNDSIYLVEQLRAFVAHHADKSRDFGNQHLSIERDIKALDAFGKGAYGKEMEAQRTILRDLLDGAQGFVHCTEAPFAEACELAVSSVMDRLWQLHEQWSDVLAPSALQQSLGSLLATVINKVLVDVEDLSDISETESQRLVSLCKRIERIERLFLPSEERMSENGMLVEDEQTDARAAMAASVHTTGLLKFQWLSQILEGSLADIRFWWNESELALAFAPNETVDLVEALFADSEHRRRTIAEIRRVRK